MTNLKKAIEFIENGDLNEARRLLKNILKEDQNNEVAWLWLSRTAKSERERLIYMKQVLRINPNHVFSQESFDNSSNQDFNTNQIRQKESWSKKTRVLIGYLPILIAIIALIPNFWKMVYSDTVLDIMNKPTAPRLDFWVEYLPGGYLILSDPSIYSEKIPAGSLVTSLPESNFLKIVLINHSDDSIVIQEKLPIKIISYQLSQKNVDILVQKGGGGGGFYRDYVAHISKTEEEYVWAQYDTSNSEKTPDFFTLATGEVEGFGIEIMLDAPGIYTILPGIDYIHGSSTHRIWAENPAIINMPKNITVWDDNFHESRYELLGQCTVNDNYSSSSDTFNCDW